MGSDHFYTVNPAEVSSAIRQDGYHLEGTACFVYDPGLNQPGTTPLFRLFNPNSGDHFYTTNPAEVRLESRVDDKAQAADKESNEHDHARRNLDHGEGQGDGYDVGEACRMYAR